MVTHLLLGFNQVFQSSQGYFIIFDDLKFKTSAEIQDFRSYYHYVKPLYTVKLGVSKHFSTNVKDLFDPLRAIAKLFIKSVGLCKRLHRFQPRLLAIRVDAHSDIDYFFEAENRFLVVMHYQMLSA